MRDWSVGEIAFGAVDSEREKWREVAEPTIDLRIIALEDELADRLVRVGR